MFNISPRIDYSRGVTYFNSEISVQENLTAINHLKIGLDF